MGKIWMQLVKSGLLSVVALVVLEILIWFGGEYFEVLPKTRALIALLVLLLWLVLFVLQRVLAARTARLLEQRLGADAQAQLQNIAPNQRGEVEQLDRNLREAIQTLKNSRLGGSALYALPWYIIIGPPGAGKSTALLESGLTFPSVGGAKRSIRGVGGTRNCDWWFTDQGILLDTAGRYTTEAEDREEWLSFLDMLRKSRKNKPVNGAIVAIAVTDLMGASDVEIEQHAENIRARLDELAERLQLVFPVYLLFTKCDLLSGFTSFFEDLGRGDRAAVFGATFPFGGTAGKSMQARFDDEFATLYRGLIARRTGLLAVERPQAKKAGIFQFPVQLALAENRLSHFIGSLFRPNPYQDSCVLRGFYFTSGTQEGAPIDQIMAAMSKAFGLSGGQAAEQAPVLEKKSYFLNHLFTKIIFPDQGLARSSAKAEKSRRMVRLAGLYGFPAATLVVLVLLFVDFFRDNSLIGRVDGLLDKLKRSDGGSPSALADSLKTLDDLRKEIKDLEDQPATGMMGLRWGKGTSRDRLAQSLRIAWFKRASGPLLEPLVSALRDKVKQLTASKPDADACEWLATLVVADEMLAPDQPTLQEQDLRRALLYRDLWPPAWKEAKDREDIVERQLEFFLETLSKKFPVVMKPWEPADTRRCEEARSRLRDDWPLAVYEARMAALRTDLQDVDLKLFAGDHLQLGPTFSKAFTPAEWRGRVQKLLGNAAEDLADRMQKARLPGDKAALAKQMTDRFRDEHRRNWRNLLANASLEATGALKVVVTRFNDLAGKESQLAAFFERVQEMERLDVPDGKEPLSVSPEPPAGLRKTLESLMPLHAEMRVLLRNPAAPVVTALDGGQLKKVEAEIASAIEALEQVKRTDRPYADSLCRIMDASIRQVASQLKVAAATEANKLWQERVATPFAAQFSELFPFAEQAEKDVALSDLTAFVNRKSGSLWAVEAKLGQLRDVRVGADPLVALSKEHDEFMAHMARIRDAFYSEPGKEDRAVLKFEVTLGLTNKTSDAIFKVCGNAPRISKKGDSFNQSQTVEWSQDCCLGTTMAVEVSSVRTDKLYQAKGEKPKSEWGLFHLVRSGAAKQKSKREFYCDLEFPVKEPNAEMTPQARLGITLAGDYEKSPFHPDFFRNIVCPSQACQ